MQEVLHFFFIKLADYNIHHPFSLQAASGHQLAQLPSMCSHWGYLVTSWLPQYIFFNFYFASFLLEFGVTSEARGHICLEAVLSWFVWPTFPCFPVSVCLTSLYPPCGSSFSVSELVFYCFGLLLALHAPFGQTCMSSPTSHVLMLPKSAPSTQTYFTLQVYMLTAPGHLQGKCAPRVPFSWNLG